MALMKAVMISILSFYNYGIEFKTQNCQETHETQKNEKLVSQNNMYKMQSLINAY